MVVETRDFRPRIGRKVNMFTPIISDYAHVVLGIAEDYNGTHTTISLAGNFERIDENTIREVVNGAQPAMRIYKIGQELPVISILLYSNKRQLTSISSASYVKVVHLHVPEHL